MTAILLDTEAAADRRELILALERVLEFQVREIVNDGWHHHRMAAYKQAERLLKQIKNENND